MIFDKELDKSLWCILETESDLREDIINFLKNIPSSFLKDIQNALCTNGLHDFNKEFIADDGSVFKCELSINEEEKVLEIENCLAKPKDKNAAYINLGTSLTLVVTYLEEEFNTFIWIGDFCNNTDFSSHFKNLPYVKNNCLEAINIKNSKVTDITYNKEQEFEYYLVPIENGAYVQRVSTYSGEKVTTEIDLEEVPEELSLEYICNEYDGDNPKRNLSF